MGAAAMKLLAALGLVLALPAHATHFDIAAGPASVSLPQYTAQSQLQVVFAYDDVQGLTTAEIRGEFEPEEALERLTRGTPLHYEFITSDAVTLTVVHTAGLDATDQMLIAEGCQFGRLPSARAATLLGIAPGYCWCCRAYDAAYQDYLVLRAQFEGRYQAWRSAQPKTARARFIALFKPRRPPPAAPSEVPPPQGLFCAALLTRESCTDFDGVQAVDEVVVHGVPDEPSIE